MFCLCHVFQGNAARPELPVPGVAVLLGNGLEGVHVSANASSFVGLVAAPPIRIEPGQNWCDFLLAGNFHWSGNHLTFLCCLLAGTWLASGGPTLLWLICTTGFFL